MGLSRDHDGSHGWEQITIPNAHWDTPIWESNRRANFMLTHEHKAHPWLFEDAGLRLGAAADCYDQAAAAYAEAIGHAAALAEELQAQQDELQATARALRGTSLHFPDREDPNLRMTGIFLADPAVDEGRRWRGWPHPTGRRRRG